jgi:hypothetical protein
MPLVALAKATPQQAVPADRFAREIDGILKVLAALAAAEPQA